MKTNEAPEKLYISYEGYGVFGEDSSIERTKISQIEYTRTDAFVEKACEFLSNEANIPLWEGYDSTFGCDTTKLIDNFKNYMKK